MLLIDFVGTKQSYDLTLVRDKQTNDVVLAKTITTINEQVRKIGSKLEQLEMLENTLIFYRSNHGELLGSQGEKDKQLPYEESVDIPLIAYWKNKIGTGVCEELIELDDLLVTISGLVNASFPRTVHGKGLYGLFFDEKAASYSVSFTMDTYVHSMDEHKRNEMDKMDDLFGMSLEISVEQQPYPVLFTATEEGRKAFAPDFPKIQIQAGTMEAALMEAKKQIQKALSQFKYPPIPTRQEDIVVPENSVLILLKTA